ncbi:hypothetical protein [Rhodospira trueperi]|uniref:Uncharacterized protein n=1 Tax=Rhodospira trueperi TaxID=69960 RepID=A0A1G7FHX3_9PROT|nr:hypothetical protein [Rhodospira trueperi]SDE75509.1 hypothetical protein SAMN05421720_11179 [Rhodospira trueperi]
MTLRAAHKEPAFGKRRLPSDPQVAELATFARTETGERAAARRAARMRRLVIVGGVLAAAVLVATLVVPTQRPTVMAEVDFSTMSPEELANLDPAAGGGGGGGGGLSSLNPFKAISEALSQ